MLKMNIFWMFEPITPPLEYKRKLPCPKVGLQEVLITFSYAIEQVMGGFQGHVHGSSTLQELLFTS